MIDNLERESISAITPYRDSVAASITTHALEVRRDDRVALQNVTISVPAGSSLAVIGPNGSGKSTLLGALAGTLAPTSGTCSVAGPAPALVLQSTEVDQSVPITVRDAVSMARFPSLGLFRRFRATDHEAVDQAMERMAITDLGGEQLHQLSGGQRQRVLVAQGLAQESDVLMLDEPVTGLDVPSRAMILDTMDEEVASGRTVVVTTHSLDEAQRCDQVLLLNTSPIAVGPPAEVLTEDHLRLAFGTQVIRVHDALILDDPHHHHHH